MAAKGIGFTLSAVAGNFFTNVKKAESAVGGLKQKLTGTTTAMKKHESGLGSLAKKAVGVATAYVGLRQIVNFGKDCIEAANGQIKAEERLDQLMMNVKGTTKEAVQSVKLYSSELQKITTVGDEVSMVGASQLATFQMQSDTIKKLMPAMNDLAVSTYGVNVSQDQMQQTANLVGKVMNGNVGALTRVGVTFDKTQEKILKTGTESQRAAALVDVLGKNFGGLAERMAQTPEGRIVQFKNAWGDVKEEIGMRLYPAITDLFGWLSDKIPVIQDKVVSAVDKVSPYMQNAVDLIKTGMDGVGKAIGWVKDHWAWLEPVIGGVVGAMMAYKGAVVVLTAAQWALNAAQMASPINWIVVAVVAAGAAIGAVVGFIVVLYKRCEGFRNFVNKAFGVIASVAKKAWEGIKSALAPLINAIKGAFSAAVGAAKVIWGKIAPFVKLEMRIIKAALSVVVAHVKGLFGIAVAVVKAGLNNVVGYFTAVFNTIKGVFSVIKNVLTGNWSAAWEAVKGIVGTWKDYFLGVWGGIKGVFSAVGSYFKGTFSAAWEAAKSVFTNIKDFISGVWDSIKNGARGMVNGIIGAVNKLIGGVNKISFTLPESMGGATVGFNIPTIPMLAKGGVISRAGSVIVGERGPELLNLSRGASVIPLGKGGGTVNKNTFYITITPRNSDDDGINEMVRRIKLALETM